MKQQLPTEIMCHIATHINDPKTFRSFALACREFSFIAAEQTKNKKRQFLKWKRTITYLVEDLNSIDSIFEQYYDEYCDNIVIGANTLNGILKNIAKMNIMWTAHPDTEYDLSPPGKYSKKHGWKPKKSRNDKHYSKYNEGCKRNQEEELLQTKNYVFYTMTNIALYQVLPNDKKYGKVKKYHIHVPYEFRNTNKPIDIQNISLIQQ